MPAASTRSHPDDVLLAAARRGCAESIGELYERYHRLAVGVAVRTLGPEGRSLAEDAAQSAFLEVFGALRNGRGPTTSLRPYLITAVRRHAIRAQQRTRSSDDRDRRAAEASLRVAPGEVLADGDGAGHELLRGALDALPARLRTVLWATEVEGCSTAELAERLGVSASAVYVLRYRARRRLTAAYLERYLAVAGSDCRGAVDELAGVLELAARDGDGVDATTGVEAPHLASCAPCRDLLRGVDVAVA